MCEDSLNKNNQRKHVSSESFGYKTRNAANNERQGSFKCSYCEFKATSEPERKKHERIHTGDRGFICNCPNCDFAAKTTTHLNDHKRTHTGERPFPCPHCDYAAKQNSNLRTHIKRVHQNSTLLDPDYSPLESDDDGTAAAFLELMPEELLKEQLNRYCGEASQVKIKTEKRLARKNRRQPT